MYKKILTIIFILFITLPVCAKRQSEEIITTMTQLQKRNFQTRTYQSNDKALVMKALLNVFQDEGYMVYNVNSLLGYIYSVKDFDTTDPNIDISKEFGITKSRMSYNGVKIATVESAANVTELGDNIRVRVNFKRKLLNEYGNAQLVEDIDEQSFYENFYSKVDNSLNLQKQTKTPTAKKEIPVVEKKETPEIIENQPQVKELNVEKINEPSLTETGKTEDINTAKDIEIPATNIQESVREVEEEISRIDSPYFRPEDILYESDSKELARRDKLIQKEEKEKAKIEAKAAKEEEKLAKARAKEQAKEEKEREIDAKIQERLSRELEKEQEKQSKQEAKIIKQLEKINQ